MSPRLAGKYLGLFVALALVLPVLAQSEIKPSLAPPSRLLHAPRETSTTLRVLILVSGLLVLLVVVSRWRKIRRLSRLSRSAWPASASKQHPHSHGLFSSHGHHHHRRRREHRRRNPTLAETGGLPPIRSEIQPPPPT